MIPPAANLIIDAAANCTACNLPLIAQCNAHASEALAVGLVIGGIVGAIASFVGLWYYGRKPGK